jgi:hypothetical protein
MPSKVTPVAGSRARLTVRKKLAFGIVYAFFMVFSLLCVGELTLRVLPVWSFKSAPFRRYDPDIGIALIPKAHVIHWRGCFQGEVSVNQWGMRDRDRSLEKSPGEFRIALLGDSVVEGVQVRPDEVVNIRMEKLLQDKGYKNVEVLNFGVEGIGTTQEFVMYKQRVRRFRPDLVVLTFVGNDIMNNSSTLQPKAYGIHTWYCPYFDLGRDGNLIFRPVEPRPFNKVRSFLEAHSVALYYFERMWSRVKLPLFNYSWQGIPIEWGVYGDLPDAEWGRAWLVTEKVMALLHETVSGDGAKFIVLLWPELHRIDPDWQRRFMKQVGRVPLDFKPTTVEDRLTEIADRNRITLDFVYPYMQAYRDAHHLQWPYFSFTCDPHYSALGHQVLAEAVVQRLQEHHLLPERADSPRQWPATK